MRKSGNSAAKKRLARLVSIALSMILAAGIDLSLFWSDIIICITLLIQIFPNVVLFTAESNRIQFGKKNYDI